MRRGHGSTQAVKGRRAHRPKTRKALTAAPSIADLQRQVGSLTRELDEAREERTATADVLNVISRSAFDLHAVLQTLVESAARLCDADMAQITRQRDGVLFRAEAYGFPEQFVEYSRTIPVVADRGSAIGRALLEGRSVHVPDALADPEYTFTEAQRLANFRTVLAVPMLREGAPIGVIVMTRKEARPFTQKQIELATTFADQAVIAIQNVKLFDEARAKSRDLEESLQQQTATSEVLQIISSSPGDLVPVFENMLANATRVCGAIFGTMNLYEDGSFHPVAHYNVPSAYAASLDETPFRPHPQSGLGTVARTHQVVHIEDIRTLPPYLEGDPSVVKIADLAGARTYFVVPMLKKNDLIGTITIYRQEVKPFTAKQTELVANFAKQAVIAIENVRLITETREALERQTATAEVLQVINSSPGDLAPVFQTMLEKAHSLCGISYGSLQLYDGEKFRAVAVHGISEAFANRLRQGFVPGPNHPSQPLLKGARFAQAPDCAEIDDPLVRAAFELAGFRTVLFIPLRKDGGLLGQIAAARQEVRPFTEKGIALLENFAAQAVIAIENARLLTETREALERQTAAAEVLQVINSSPGDLAPVFERILEKAHSLCAVALGTLLLYDGENFRAVAVRGYSEAFAARLRQGVVPGPNLPHHRLLEGARFAQVVDWAEIDDPFARASLEAGARTTLLIPLRREGALLGYIAASRAEVKPFIEKEIALLESFAGQAVIAMENARLLGELHERQADLARSVDELTATGDVLKIISRSTTDLETVLDTLVETVARLCRADQALIFRWRDDLNHLAAAHGVSGEARQFMLANPLPPDRGTLSGRVGLERRVVHIPDVMKDEEYTYWEAQKKQGQRTMLGIPLLRGDSLIGIFSITRTRVDPFTSKEIELAATFADQAVIAIENARLFEELRERQAELARSVDELTATGDVLKIISRSTTAIEKVLDTLVETVTRLCRADWAAMYRRRDEMHHLVASYGLSAEMKEFFRTHPVARGRGTMSGRVEFERRAVHIPDVLQDPEYTFRDGQKAGGYRTLLGVPLLRGDEPIGHFNIGRARVEPFTNKEIELATTFADQAVIAMENARLFDELRERQAELRVTFDNMGDGVVMFDSGLRLTAWNRNFQKMLELPDAFLAGRPSNAEFFRYLADRGEYSADLEAQLNRANKDPRQELRIERTRPDGRIVEVRRNPVPGGGFVLIYSDITQRKRAEEAVRAARDAAESALRELQTAQDRLVQTQKLASLGQLTAGIAHEIKNPLNFVNNFAALSSELTDELSDVLKPVALPGKVREEVEELAGTLKDNLGKVVQHGKRADSIVKNMLLHSREGSGEHRQVEINAIIDESLNLAYHGARAEKQGFNITLERDFDPAAGIADIYPQEVTRVLLNLISNGFYAATKRARVTGDGFEPKLKAATRNLGDRVEVRIRDNGSGIPPNIKEKIFNPFFTTKPAGEGTGLGLSMSHDIVVKQHGGTIDVVTEPGSFTEFIITLPRIMPA